MDCTVHWRRKWQPTPVLMPGKSHGWRSVVAKSGTRLGDFHFHPLQYSCLENISWSIFACQRQKKMVTEDQMVGWHHKFNGHELGQTPGYGEGQRGLVNCSSWGHKELDTTW